MEEAPENSNEFSHSAHGNGLNECVRCVVLGTCRNSPDGGGRIDLPFFTYSYINAFIWGFWSKKHGNEQ
jgi:hypothetical protein